MWLNYLNQFPLSTLLRYWQDRWWKSITSKDLTWNVFLVHVTDLPQVDLSKSETFPTHMSSVYNQFLVKQSASETVRKLQASEYGISASKQLANKRTRRNSETWFILVKSFPVMRSSNRCGRGGGGRGTMMSKAIRRECWKRVVAPTPAPPLFRVFVEFRATLKRVPYRHPGGKIRKADVIAYWWKNALKRFSAIVDHRVGIATAFRPDDDTHAPITRSRFAKRFISRRVARKRTNDETFQWFSLLYFLSFFFLFFLFKRSVLLVTFILR